MTRAAHSLSLEPLVPLASACRAHGLALANCSTTTISPIEVPHWCIRQVLRRAGSLGPSPAWAGREGWQAKAYPTKKCSMTWRMHHTHGASGKSFDIPARPHPTSDSASPGGRRCLQPGSRSDKRCLTPRLGPTPANRASGSKPGRFMGSRRSRHVLRLRRPGCKQPRPPEEGFPKVPGENRGPGIGPTQGVFSYLPDAPLIGASAKFTIAGRRTAGPRRQAHASLSISTGIGPRLRRRAWAWSRRWAPGSGWSGRWRPGWRRTR